jgi:hypothetical protein
MMPLERTNGRLSTAAHYMILMLWNHDGHHALYIPSSDITLILGHNVDLLFAGLIIVYISDAGGRQWVFYKDLSFAFSSSLITRFA